LSIEECRHKFWQKTEDGPNLVKRDRSITISLGQGPFYGSIGIGLVHTMSNMLNKTIQVANSPKRKLFQECGSYKIKCSNNDILDIGPNPMAFSAKPIENGDAISKYATFYLPKYGKFYGIVMDISQQTTFCLSFNTVSSEESNGGNKKCNRTWNLIVFPLNMKMDDEATAYNLDPSFNALITSLPIQVMAEQRWSKTTKRTHNGEHESLTVQSFLEWAEKQPDISENKKLKIVDLLGKK